MASTHTATMPRAVDDLLGRSFTWHQDGYTIKTFITVIAHNPEKGWLLDAGKDFSKEWVSDLMLSALLAEGVFS